MKNEITIYELIGLIKDGKAPKKIICFNKVYRLHNNKEDYISQDKSTFLSTDLKRTVGNNFLAILLQLNVEILPEEKEWEDIEEINVICDSIEFYDDEKVRHLMNTNAKDRNIYIVKINQLIKNQKYLKEKLENTDAK